MHTQKTFSNDEKISLNYELVTDLIPYARNPRIHSKKQIRQLAKSIKVFGFNVPILINKENRVIAGHGRLLACQELGIKEVPVIRLEHLTEDQARAFMIADNKLTENAEWDDKMLGEHFSELLKLDLNFDLDCTGFEIGEIDFLIESLEAPDEVEETPLPPLNAIPVSKLGDVWILGEHRLFCGNSLNPASFEKLMDGQKARLVFTDPPYNVPIAGHVSGLGKVEHREFAMASGEMTVPEFTNFLDAVFQNLVTHSIDGAIHYICMDWRHGQEVLAAGKHYSALKNICVWCKDNAGMGSFYRSQHEFIYVFKHGTAPHLNNFQLGQYGRYRTNIWEYPGANSYAGRQNENILEMHPTVKPVAMVADAIKDCSNPHEIILDAFLGSGSTLIAAEKTDRRCFGIEIDPLYLDVSIRRWQQIFGKIARHAETGLTFTEMEKQYV